MYAIAFCLGVTCKVHEQDAKEFRFWSYNCAGQNRNRIMFTFYVCIAHKLNITIELTFLQKGDSLHALIVRSSKKNVFIHPLNGLARLVGRNRRENHITS
ncbi:unnamed protein product [Chrysodeixis includens]|uniref:Uncharacterized protein n=1 Tax=Chrysodeixis includens TaxID=689277 RepID=A0A9P0BRJ8_CHRIL|nr:unnamed protein product [Chrysodeixis includens]